MSTKAALCLIRMVETGAAAGNLAAHIAALLVEHGVSELWTTDRDFLRFPEIRSHDPFAGTGVDEPRRWPGPSIEAARSTRR